MSASQRGPVTGTTDTPATATGGGTDLGELPQWEGLPPREQREQRARRRRERGKTASGEGAAAGNMLPGRKRRTLGLERLLVRLIATGGVVGIGVALGAILASDHVQGWIIGLVISLVSIVLSAMLWSSRQL